jgi:hypothetical protein
MTGSVIFSRSSESLAGLPLRERLRLLAIVEAISESRYAISQDGMIVVAGEAASIEVIATLAREALLPRPGEPLSAPRPTR